MREKNKTSLISLILILVVLFSLNISIAQPEPPTILDSTSSRRNNTDVVSIDAIAGNVTALSIHGMTSTQTWQGFYGNITGEIVLSNNANAVMYNWSLVVPRGKIYASTNTSINWAQGNIGCYNFSITDTDYLTITELENSFDIPTDAADSIQNTFNQFTHPTIYPASSTIPENTCHSTQLYQNEIPGTDFPELLLYADDSNSVIFTSIIPGSTTGFDGSLMDFQLLVPANGRLGQTTPTTYYLYVELE